MWLYLIMQQERLFKVSSIYLSHFFFAWFLCDPVLPVCRHIPHSAPSRSPTRSSISVLSLCSLLCVHFIPPFTDKVSCWCYMHTAPHSMLHNSNSELQYLCVCSHLPVGRTLGNTAVKSSKNVKHCRVCGFSANVSGRY